MEDLWKVTRNAYRIAALTEQRDYEEIVRVALPKKPGMRTSPSWSDSARLKTMVKK